MKQEAAKGTGVVPGSPTSSSFGAGASTGRRTPVPCLAALLLIIVAVALPVRLLVCARMEMISRDGAVFIWYAQGLADDPVAEMQRQAQHPVYPALILATHEAMRALAGTTGPGPESSAATGGGRYGEWRDPVLRWQTAGMAVTLLGGLLVVAAIHALTVRLFDRRTALLAAGLAALAAEFCQLSADVLSDMPHLGIHLFALVVAIDALKTGAGRGAGCHGRLVLAGALSGLAFLIRPEGAEPAVAAGLAVVFLAGGWRWRERAIGLLALGVGAAAPAVPYMFITGKLVPKKSVKQFLPGTADEGVGGVESHLAQPLAMRRERIERCFGISTSSTQGLASVALGLHSAPLRGPLLPALPAPRGGVVGEYRIVEDLVHGGNLLVLVPGELSSRRVIGRPSGAAAMASGARVRRGSVSPIVEASSASDIGRALVLIGEKWVRSLRVTFLIPFVVWFLVRRVVRAERTALRLVEIVAGLHLCILLALIIRFDYWELFSLRHVMVLAGLVLPFSAAGVMAIVDALAARWQNRSWVKIAFTGGLLAVLVAPTLPWMLQRRNAHDAYLRRAGEWIRGQTWGAAHRPDAGATPDWREAGIAPPAILTTRHQVAFYAGGMQVWSPLDADAEAILLEARTHRPGWLVFDERRMLRMSSTFFKDLEAAVLAGEVLDRVREEPSQDGKAGHRAVIYRYVAPG